MQVFSKNVNITARTNAIRTELCTDESFFELNFFLYPTSSMVWLYANTIQRNEEQGTRRWRTRRLQRTRHFFFHFTNHGVGVLAPRVSPCTSSTPPPKKKPLIKIFYRMHTRRVSLMFNCNSDPRAEFQGIFTWF